MGIDSRLLARAADGENWDRPNQRFDVVLEGGQKVEWFTGKNVQASGLLNWGSSDPNNPNSVPAANLVYTLILRDHRAGRHQLALHLHPLEDGAESGHAVQLEDRRPHGHDATAEAALLD